jgi:polyhydroxybutyrate depolymerase
MGFASRCLLLLAVAGALACARKETRRVLVTTAASTPRAVTSAQGAPASVPAPGDSANSPPAVPPLEAELHLPKTAPGERSPLFLFLHGFGASAETIIENTDWVEFAERSRIAWMAPDGPKDRQGRRFWNAGDSCCNLGREPVDHVRALGALIERSLATDAIDAARVFVVGFSNGGFMAHRLGCEIPELVRGIVSLAG